MKKKILRVIITGGGSGGHAMPALAMIQTLRNSEFIRPVILYIGSKNSLEKNMANKNRVKFTSIHTGKFRRYFSFKNFTDIFKVIFGIIESFAIMLKFKPKLIFSTGGYVSIPPVIAAKFCKVPIIIHEQTIDAGLANKIASFFADKICLTFKESAVFFPKKKCLLTGIPLRDEIFRGEKEEAFKKFNLNKDLPVVYFTGGGQGCHILNQTALKILPRLLEKCNVIYQAGTANKDDYVELLKYKNSLEPEKARRFKLYDFIYDDLPFIYAASDLAVSRSGAGTVNEFLAMKIPAIFIPLAISHNNEQLKHAMIFEHINGGVIIEEKDLNEELLYSSILDILFTKIADQMQDNLIKYSFKNGNLTVQNVILSYLLK